MSLIVGVRFKKVGKIYYFSPENLELKLGDGVIVETARGIEFGKVAIAPKEVSESEVVKPLKQVLRKATQKDVDQVLKNNDKRRQAFEICEEKIKTHGLDMKLVDVEYTFDKMKVIFYFTSESRVDFRELVKELAQVFKIRIELRQIGIRDESKFFGGISPCGRVCCCASHLGDFEKVSIKMAKTQGLSLNPTKISGLCGRLMCCLSYENEHYAETSKRMPKINSTVSTPEGKGAVLSNDMLKEIVTVKIEKGETYEIKYFPLADVVIKEKIKVEEEVHVGEEISKLLEE